LFPPELYDSISLILSQTNVNNPEILKYNRVEHFGGSMTKIEDYGTLFNTLTLYREVLDNETIKNFSQILNLISKEENIDKVIKHWSDMVFPLYNNEFGGNWTKYINNLILTNKNYFTLKCASKEIGEISENILSAAQNDIEILTSLSTIKCSDFKDLLYFKFPYDKDTIDILASFETDGENLSFEKIADFHKKNGVGIFSKYKAFKFTHNNEILPVLNCDNVRLKDLKRYEREQNIVVENTLGFLKGKPYNNVLLYGDRGTGKSSTVKAILNEYHSEGLRVIQIFKEDLIRLDLLMQKISEIPLKFIIFIDDLTFNENDDNFGALKAVLEGSVAKQPDNMALYATTNRRHLVKESFKAREGDEVHLADTIDETVSLSDRFGITVTYSVPSKDKFLEIVKEIKEDRNLKIEDEILFKGAESFALSKGKRSPRLAKQYIDYVQSRLELGLEIERL